MKVVFLGVGEAFDEEFSNNSILIRSGTNILLDCGYSAPGNVWRLQSDQTFLDAIYISHTHADHYFGIPPLLVRMWEEKRQKPLTIICPAGSTESVRELIEYAYKGISEKFEFIITFKEADTGKSISLGELRLTFAPTEHPANNHAVRIHDRRNTVCFSGDGMFRKETEELYRDADLLIHEAYSYDMKLPGHACVTDLVHMAKRMNIKCLALTHLQRKFRKNDFDALKKKFLSENLKVIVPQPFEEFYL
jgi:ribonuclease BN (tRNA processing enzyme)